MTGFGDDEPEDAWHPDDPIEELLDNLDRRCTILGERKELREHLTPVEWLEEIEARLERIRVRRHELSAEEWVRAGMIEDDVEFLWTRM